MLATEVRRRKRQRWWWFKSLQAFEGFPAPSGATALDGGVNFAVFSSNAVSATLFLMSLSDLHEGDFEDMLYGNKFDGKFFPEGHYYDPSQILLDPYAKAVLSRGEFGVLEPEGDCWPQMACMVPFANGEFVWEGDLLLKFQQRDLVVYEMHVCGFTRHDSSRTDFPGTYVGVADKLDHLKELGVN